ncbi:Alpha/beta hydrolase family protein [Aquisphaera giovannonii]|uniref:Alpha/beta hydrolase family protein n=1 Tax=Aquisphaera giovannonii TaxID=406548 RepID=A0A5B9W043_9BACT|nr:hypothetical protein [Aquisphaera giovannonii]QEH33609.1 Alpha/beta hydrolase family protein [Aquisphaera giovannonii]
MHRSETHLRLRPIAESLESRSLMAMVFLLNGNGYAQASPSIQTRVAAADLARRGHTPIQVSYASMTGLGPYLALANSLVRASQGQPIGLIGFSAGGTLALRLASYPGLRVSSVLNFYGPPDLAGWLSYHGRDMYARRISQNIDGSRAFIDAMSGPGDSSAHLVSVFGERDRNVDAVSSASSFRQDFRSGVVYTYAGNHGVTIRAQPTAYQDFLSHLPPVTPAASSSPWMSRFRLNRDRVVRPSLPAADRGGQIWVLPGKPA